MHKLNKKLKENLYSEIHILKGLHHPHIVALIDCQETSAHIHLIMEFCELGDLSYFIKKRDTLSRHPTTADMIRKYPNPAAGGLNEVVVRHFLKQLASALQFLRAKNFIHRDVKPQNLLLDPSPQYYRSVKPEHVPYAAHERSMTPLVGLKSLPTLKLADFGFARSLPSTSLAETLCGSPLYMAPEILRYEKYDAKADLWSVGTVLYEMMVGKPPFRASNHVELLRKIERGEDRIRFPEEVCLSDSIKKLIRGLLKRNPVERMGFEEFFNNTVVKDEIPGLVEDDRPTAIMKSEMSLPSQPSNKSEGKRAESSEQGVSRATTKAEVAESSQQPTRRPLSESPTTAVLRAEAGKQRHSSGTPPRTASGDLRERQNSSDKPKEVPKEVVSGRRRPSMTTHATAPARHDLLAQATKNANATDTLSQKNRNTFTPKSPTSPTRGQERERRKHVRETQERAAQDVAFERDYVLIDKRNVEVNAFADELAASPRIYSTSQNQPNSNRGALVRRATTQGPPGSTTGAQGSPSKMGTAASGRRTENTHHRQSSYERRLRDAPSATSAISKAINMASGRLFNLGLSPPLGVARSGPSPPSYSPFPAYPTTSGSVLMLQDGTRAPVPLDEDTRALQAIEESATRSNVVYGFAEIKFQQLIPLAPSTDQGLGVAVESNTSEEVDLNVGATVTCAEEALVLYVKALSLLARSMNIAGAWWARKNKADNGEESTSSKPASKINVGNRVNNVVQWVRGRFNEVLEKAEFVRLKLIDAQNQLPQDHPSHPSNNQSSKSDGPELVSSTDNVTVTPGVTAEKLMYDYALDKSRSAAVSELVGDNLQGCEIDYITAIWLLEAILEDDDEAISLRKDAGSASKERRKSSAESGSINGVEAEDRKVVLKRKRSLYRLCLNFTNVIVVVQSIRTRHAALQKKLEVLARRPSTSSPAPPPLSKSPRNAIPSIATTPPR